MITLISRRRPPCIMHHTSALQWMRGDGWDSLIHYQHRPHCHPFIDQAASTIMIIFGPPASEALFMVYERYSGGWRSRFVGARSKFHAVFDGARLRGSSENLFVVGVTYLVFKSKGKCMGKWGKGDMDRTKR